jgi:hypothetical protein
MQIAIGHANPDFDAYASTVAATKLFEGAKGVFSEVRNANVRAFHNLHEAFDFASAGLDLIPSILVVMVAPAIPIGSGS